MRDFRAGSLSDFFNEICKWRPFTVSVALGKLDPGRPMKPCRCSAKTAGKLRDLIEFKNRYVIGLTRTSSGQGGFHGRGVRAPSILLARWRSCCGASTWCRASRRYLPCSCSSSVRHFRAAHRIARTCSGLRDRISRVRRSHFDDRHCPRPAGRGALDFCGKAADREARGRQDFEIMELLDMTVADMPPRFVALPDD